MTARILIIALCRVVAVGGVGAALGKDGDDQVQSMDPVDVRKDDSLGDTELVDDEPDDDPTTATRPGATTARVGVTTTTTMRPAATMAGAGDDSEYVAPAPAPAPAPVYDDYSDDGGYAVSGS